MDQIASYVLTVMIGENMIFTIIVNLYELTFLITRRGKNP
jgi:hypothetical protein